DSGSKLNATLQVVTPYALVRFCGPVPPAIALAEQVPARSLGMEVLNDREPSWAFLDTHHALIDSSPREPFTWLGADRNFPPSNPGIEKGHFGRGLAGCYGRRGFGLARAIVGFRICKDQAQQKQQSIVKNDRFLHIRLLPPTSGVRGIATKRAGGQTSSRFIRQAI